MKHSFTTWIQPQELTPGGEDWEGSGIKLSVLFVARLTCARNLLSFFLVEIYQASLWKAMMSEAGGKEAEGKSESLQLGSWTSGRLRVREILLEAYLIEKQSGKQKAEVYFLRLIL